MKTVHFLYRKEYEKYVKPLQELETNYEVLFHAYDSLDELQSLNFSAILHIVAIGSLQNLKRVIELSCKHDVSMGIVPLPDQSKLTKILDLPKNIKDAYLMALKPCDKKIDMFYCNDIPIISDVRIGDSSVLKNFEYSYASESTINRLKLFWGAWRQKRALRHYEFQIKTQKEDAKTFSAVGLIGIDYDNRSWIARVLRSHLGVEDGQHILAILSPTSLFQYFIAQPMSLFWQNSNTQKLPKRLGFIKSNYIEVSCNEPLEVVIDDSESMQTPVTLRSEEKALALSVGEGFWEKQVAAKSERSSIKLDNIPKDEESIKYLSNGLPLFEHASKEQYATLFSNLREDGRITSVFLVMLIFATMIATLGLFINSASVIIGAMLIAPLMQPIVSLGMGALRQDGTLQLDSAKTIAIGVLAVLLTSALIALGIPMQKLTSEMAGRLSPSILDLFVAIVSGMAAAYAKNNEKILGSLAGVSIAVALVPPIAVAGIGLGWGEWGMFSSAFLLFITNLVGIVFAVALTFMILGFSPVKVAKKGLGTWLVVMALVAIPLYSSFVKMQESARIQRILTNTYFSFGEKKLELTHIEPIHRGSKLEVRCEVISSGVLTDKDKSYLKEVITKSIGREVEVIATFRYRLQ